MNEAALLFTLAGLALVASVIVILDKCASPESKDWSNE